MEIDAPVGRRGWSNIGRGAGVFRERVKGAAEAAAGESRIRRREGGPSTSNISVNFSTGFALVSRQNRPLRPGGWDVLLCAALNHFLPGCRRKWSGSSRVKRRAGGKMLWSEFPM